MNPILAMSVMANILPALARVKRRTWIIIALVLTTMLALALWAMLAVAGWLFGQGQTLIASVPVLNTEAAKVAIEQAKARVSEQISAGIPQIPQLDAQIEAARAKLEQAKQQASEVIAAAPVIAAGVGAAGVGILQSTPAADVSGQELAPFDRFPGLIRTSWQKQGESASVSYQGIADFGALITHYAAGFASAGFSQSVESASANAESHTYSKGGEIILLSAKKMPGARVELQLQTQSAERAITP